MAVSDAQITDLKELHNSCRAEQREERKDIWTAIEDLRKALSQRLPIWATLGFSFLTFIIGILITVIRIGLP